VRSRLHEEDIAVQHLRAMASKEGSCHRIIDQLEASLKHKRGWRLHWEGEAVELRNMLDTLRARPPPRGIVR